MAPACNHHGEKARGRGEKAGGGPYDDVEFQRRLAGEEGRRSGGSTAWPRLSGGSELGQGFTVHEGGRWLMGDQGVLVASVFYCHAH
jgi:hypothetical protein